MTSADSSRPAPGLRALVALLAIGGWVALLQARVLQPPGVGAAGFWDVRSLAAATASLARALGDLGLEALRFAPLGALAVVAFPDRARRLARAALVGLPAFGLGLSASAAALWLRDAAAGPPGPSDLLLPAVGVFAGVLCGLALRRGRTALLLLPLKLAGASLLAALVVLAVLAASLEREAAVPPAPEVRTAEKRRVVAVFRGKDPRDIPQRQLRTVRLGQDELDHLVAWVLPLVQSPEHVRAAVVLGTDDAVLVRVSARVPRLGRWLNVLASARAGVRGGRFFLREPRLHLGPLVAPAPLMDALAPALAGGIRAERRLRPALEAVRELRVERGVAVATYGRMRMPRGLVASVVWGEGSSATMREPVAEQVRAVLDALAATPPGDARFARAYEAAFRLARERSRDGSAVDENRAAILALGIVLGSEQLSPVAGDAVTGAQKDRSAELRRGATLRGRADWTRHFSLSSAITVVSAVAPSNAAGLLKEELDADGGSGFSFGDLMADRAGTAFGALATRDEPRAAAVQERIAAGFDVDAFFPSARDLPENIPDEELRIRYGGVGGDLYRRQADEVERRLASCAAYR